MKRSKIIFEIVCIIITAVIMAAFWFIVGYVLDNIAQNNSSTHGCISFLHQNSVWS